MPPVDYSEAGLELLITSHLTGVPVEALKQAQSGGVAEAPVGYDAGWLLGLPQDFDREYALDTKQLYAFLEQTQPEKVAAENIAPDGISRQKFLARIQGEITKRGVVDVLRKGIRHNSHHFDLYYPLPSPGNAQAADAFRANRFTVTRQLEYSKDGSKRALDLALFINGLPIATFELKNRTTGQSWKHAIAQYQNDRSPKELIFQPGRCAVHVAMDDDQVHFCTRLEGRHSTFLPFNRGVNNGAGNPVDPAGTKTRYLWHEVLERRSLADILENYVQFFPKEKRAIFPRYHQLDAVRKLVRHAREHGAGQRYLIQHSAGSGKSNTIAWLTEQLIEIERNGQPVFNTVIVVTDRRVLDKQLRDTVKAMSGTAWVIGAAERSGQLREFIQQGKRIITTTVQKFPLIVDDIGNAHRDRTFAIIIDEAHSSQGGRAAGKMNAALSAALDIDLSDEELSYEDLINYQIQSRQMLDNASYFAFTATPKNKTLEIFGSKQPDGTFAPFHVYSMKQAIEEGFIVDVLQNVTPIKSYYQVHKTVEADPQYDVQRAKKRLWAYVEGHRYATRQKAAIMVDHYHESVAHRLGNRARAMVATASIRQAITYWEEISDLLKARKSPYKVIVAFSGEAPRDGKQVTEADLNGFPSNDIPAMFETEPYRILVVADKFLTGFDQPLLQTMYVDKPLSGIKAVQTLSRLNRAYPGKTDTFVLDFENPPERIQEAFQPYYTSTMLSGSTDPNKLHDLKAALDEADVYTDELIETVAARFLKDAENREQIDPLLDGMAARYRNDLDEDGQVLFKGNAKQFVRTYNFLASIIPWLNPEWEKLSILLTLLIPRLPTPTGDDDTKALLDNVDVESYRVEKLAAQQIILEDETGTVEPAPVGDIAFWQEAEKDLLSNIVRMFNDLVGDIEWTDADRIRQFVTETVPDQLSTDERVVSAFTHSDEQNRRKEVEEAVKKMINAAGTDHLELYKQFTENQAFKNQIHQIVYDAVVSKLHQSQSAT